MTTTKLSKRDRDIMKSFKVSQMDVQPYITVQYDIEHYSQRQGAIIKSPRSFSLQIDTSPTNNCQMASIKGFYSACNMFKTPRKELIKYQKERRGLPKGVDLGDMTIRNSRVQKLVILTAIANVYELITRKRLFFIDIPIYYKDGYYELHPFLFKKRLKSREVEYISTNGNKLMYSVIELDVDKVSLYK